MRRTLHRTLAALVLASTFLGTHAATLPYPDERQDIQREPERDVPNVHDPVMAYENGRYYIFSTGMGVSVMSSADMKAWKRERPVFDHAPEWAVGKVRGYRGHTWAPDICFVNGLWHLYYSCSAFGKNTSVIGLAVNKTLDPSSPDFRWEDKGLVIESTPRKTDWNAIDPNVITDEKGRPWMVFGSFWDGIQLVRLDKKTMKVKKDAKPSTVSRRFKRPTNADEELAGDNAVEAPFIIHRGDYYYLFVSFDYCCKGLGSTYKTVVGRSKKVNGPYYDKSGKAMSEGGGTLIVGPNDDYAGVGHCSVYEFNGKWTFVAHGYSKAHNGASKLFIKGLEFDSDGWPKLEEPGK